MNPIRTASSPATVATPRATLRYLEQESGQTRREGLDEYYGSDPSLLAPRALPDAARRSLLAHDAAHVVFGCDTSARGEIVLSRWTLRGATDWIPIYARGLAARETRWLFVEFAKKLRPLSLLQGLFDVPAADLGTSRELESLDSELLALRIQWVQGGLMALGFLLVLAWATYVRTRLALHGTASVLWAGWCTLFTIVLHPIRTLRPLILLGVVEVALVVGLFGGLTRVVDARLEEGGGRLVILGIRKKWRNVRRYAGLSAYLYVAMNQAGHLIGIRRAELSWTLDDNAPVNVGIKMMGAHIYKTYRIYEKAL